MKLQQVYKIEVSEHRLKVRLIIMHFSSTRDVVFNEAVVSTVTAIILTGTFLEISSFSIFWLMLLFSDERQNSYLANNHRIRGGNEVVG